MYYYTAARREYTASAKVSQFWVNPVLIVNCTFWKNIWQVSVFLFVISTQQSVPIMICPGDVWPCDLFLSFLQPHRWCLTGSWRCVVAARRLAAGRSSPETSWRRWRVGRSQVYSTETWPRSWEELGTHWGWASLLDTVWKNTDTLKTLIPTVRPVTVNKPFSFLCFTFKPAFFWLVTWSKQSNWAAGGASVQLVLVSSC